MLGNAKFYKDVLIDGSLNVLGYAYFAHDISVNGLTVGVGGSDVSSNTVVGYQALTDNTIGILNTAVGYQALTDNTIGSDNTAVGYQALKNNSTGSTNTALGLNTLHFNTFGGENTALGHGSLYTNIDGSYNTASGMRSLHTIQHGSFNTASGFYAGYYDVSGNANTYLGVNTGQIQGDTSIYYSSTAIGAGAIIDSSNQIVLGTINEGVYIPGGYLKIGSVTAYNPSSGYALYVDGSANFTNGIRAASCTTTSDYRVKENVTKLNDTFVVDNLNPVTYTNTITLKQDVGFIAHELQEVYPFLVNGLKDGEQFQSVNYIGLIGILTKEIQEIKERVKILEEK